MKIHGINWTEDAIIQGCFEAVLGFFENNYKKTLLWFSNKNPLLGNVSPIEMLKNGRVEKLCNFIHNQISENTLNENKKERKV